MNESRVDFEADGIRLEGQLHLPENVRRGIVFCHPHPQYGGDMDNSIVLGVVKRMQRDGWATLRFNFRGVGASQGSYGGGDGEQIDARSAVSFLASQTGLSQVALGGYSFGSIVALGAGYDLAAVDRLIGVAPPLSMFSIDFLRDTSKPTFLLVGEADQFCPLGDFESAAGALGEHVRGDTIAGADHFFGGEEDRLGGRIAAFLDDET